MPLTKLTQTPTQKIALLGHGQALNPFSHMRNVSVLVGQIKHVAISTRDISTLRSLQGKGYQQILLLHRMMTVYLSFKNLLIPDNIPSSL